MNWAPEYNSFVLKGDAKGGVPNELGRKMQKAECRMQNNGKNSAPDGTVSFFLY